jgi:hypothetical protein
LANRHLARREHVIVFGPSRIRPLRRLARRPVPRYTFLIFAAGVTAGFSLLAAGHPGLALIAFGVPLLVVLPVLTALWTRRIVILDGREEITWRAAQRAYENADRLASQVLTLFPDEDPRDALRRARMELARLLAERRRLRVAWREATTAGYRLAVGDPLRDRLTQRTSDLEERIAALGAEAGKRTESFTSLATVWGEFVWQREGQSAASVRHSAPNRPSPAPTTP